MELELEYFEDKPRTGFTFCRKEDTSGIFEKRRMGREENEAMESLANQTEQ